MRRATRARGGTWRVFRHPGGFAGSIRQMREWARPQNVGMPSQSSGTGAKGPVCCFRYAAGRSRAAPEGFLGTRIMRKARLLAALVCAVASASAAVSYAADANSYRTRLSMVPIDVSMQVNIAGAGQLTATLDGNKLTVNGGATGLRSPATAVRIHRGPPGIPGPAILDLTTTKTTSPTISGTVELSPSMVDDLKNGQLYVQLSSERAPEGNLRGWLAQAN